MRAVALRSALLLLPVIAVVLTGCSSVSKKTFLRHLEVTIAPAQPGTTVAFTAPDRGEEPFLAVVETNGQ